ncbi:MAG: hypothetical protein K2K56_06910 [Lachnospiraceae bacterium]|nr:hypothetical protein [Lachnospiraceae bacterium]
MDLTVFQYITEIPEVITEADYYTLACQGYNLGLTLVWVLIAMYLIDKLFVCVGKFYTRGHD